MSEAEVSSETQESDEGSDAESTELLSRPCIEEFVAANYKAEDYDTYFGAEYGPGWSDPTWTKEKANEARAMSALLRQLPDVLHVQSRVRHVSTRTLRTRQPTRHRFKQYLFSDPTLRLVRKRPVRITSSQLLHNLDELIQKEGAGILTVHLLDGRQLNLEQLRNGIVGSDTPAPAPALYNRRPDSIAHDIPSGQALPQYVDGTYPGDPAAQRTMDRMTAEKQHEAERQGANDSPPETPAGVEPMAETPAEDQLEQQEAAPETTETADVATAATARPEAEAATEVSEELPAEEPEATAEMTEEETAQAVEETTTDVDPAAARASKSSKKGKGRR